ncbi:hypothetical protein E2C01_015390 [Portunus trituberculatus]|uniref:Uncharacterized protein n=1 Tax=Portunus trituberculatus TaxID=210409 RepID=A0A5B7DN23_PORTR|nr:hypothetical protein [Portunus trituberculatus]
MGGLEEVAKRCGGGGEEQWTSLRCDGSGVEGRGSERRGAWQPTRLSQSGEVGGVGRALLSPVARSAVRGSFCLPLLYLSLSPLPVRDPRRYHPLVRGCRPDSGGLKTARIFFLCPMGRTTLIYLARP